MTKRGCGANLATGCSDNETSPEHPPTRKKEMAIDRLKIMLSCGGQCAFARRRERAAEAFHSDWSWVLYNHRDGWSPWRGARLCGEASQPQRAPDVSTRRAHRPSTPALLRAGYWPSIFRNARTAGLTQSREPDNIPITPAAAIRRDPSCEGADDEEWADDDESDGDEEAHASAKRGSGESAALVKLPLAANETILVAQDASIVRPERVVVGVLAVTVERRGSYTERRSSVFSSATTRIEEGVDVHRLRFSPKHVGGGGALGEDLGLELPDASAAARPEAQAMRDRE